MYIHLLIILVPYLREYIPQINQTLRRKIVVILACFFPSLQMYMQGLGPQGSIRYIICPIYLACASQRPHSQKYLCQTKKKKKLLLRSFSVSVTFLVLAEQCALMMLPLVFGLSFGVLFSVICFALLKWNALRYNLAGKGLPPGTMGWPVFGETTEFLKHGLDFLNNKKAM